MSTTCIQELGLAPLEQRPIQAPYTAYWSETYPTALDGLGLLNRATHRQLNLAAYFITTVTEGVIRNNDHASLPRFDQVKEHGGGRAGIIAAWDGNLGNFNGYAEGQGDLLRAAGMLLEDNVDFGQSFDLAGDELTRNPYKTFTSLWRHNTVAAQRASGILLRAGTLVHRAAWIDDNPQRQERLMGITEDIYTRVGRAGNSISGEKLRRADNYRSDVRFHLASARARHGQAHGDIAMQETAYADMAESVQVDAAKLLYRLTRVLNGPAEVVRSHTGPLGEDFVVLALRKTIVTEKLAQFGIRHSFDCEDFSLRKVVPKSSFDLVVQRHDDTGIQATPIQVKLGCSGGVGHTKLDYLPGILYVALNEDPVRLRDAAAALAHPEATSTPDNMRTFKRLEDKLGPLLLAA